MAFIGANGLVLQTIAVAQLGRPIVVVLSEGGELVRKAEFGSEFDRQVLRNGFAHSPRHEEAPPRPRLRKPSEFQLTEKTEKTYF